MTKIEVLISFPNGARFYSNLDLLIYKILTNFVYELNCVNRIEKCKDCSIKNGCNYYKLTGENFRMYPGLLIRTQAFNKNYFVKGEEKIFTFYLIGDSKIFMDYIKLLFESKLRQEIVGQFFYLKGIRISVIDENFVSAKYINVASIIETENFNLSYNNMIEYYNLTYNTNYSLIDGEGKNDGVIEINLNAFSVKTRKIEPHGYLYKVSFVDNIKFSSALFEIGIGKYNYIGGGQVEIKTDIK